MGKLMPRLKSIWDVVKKYKYATLLLVIGLGLLLLPTSGKETDETPQEETLPPISSNYEKEMEDRLSVILSQIEGVGRVEVILTLKQGQENHFLYDHSSRIDTNEGSSTTEKSEKAVIISKGSSYDEPMITRTDYPLFQGALIVCEGGGDAEIKLQLTQAVSALTNLSSHNITILKMK